MIHFWNLALQSISSSSGTRSRRHSIEAGWPSLFEGLSFSGIMVREPWSFWFNSRERIAIMRYRDLSQPGGGQQVVQASRSDPLALVKAPGQAANLPSGDQVAGFR
jgi:hypothetical protein